MKSIKASISKSYVRKDGTTTPNIHVYINRKLVKLPIDQVAIEPAFWSEKKQMVIGHHPMADELNMLVNRAKSEVNEIFIEFKLQKKILNADKLKEEYKNSSSSLDFINWAIRDLEKQVDTLSTGTYKAQMSVLKKMIEFKSPIPFSELDHNFLEDYDKYLRIHYKNELVTRYSNLKVIRKFVNRAMRENLIKHSPFDKFKLKRGKSNRDYLNREELAALLDIYYKNNLNAVQYATLKAYLFGCATSIRLGDIKRLDWRNIKSKAIRFVPSKTQNSTGEEVSIPFNPLSRQIINSENKKLRGPVFSLKITEQAINRNIKDIADMVGIDKDISFHTSRHTFATLFYEETNDLLSLQKILGHSDIKSTLIYAHLSERKKYEQMNKYADLLSKLGVIKLTNNRS